MSSFLLACFVACTLFVSNKAFVARPFATRPSNYAIKMSFEEIEMDVGEFEQAIFKKTAVVKGNVGKYTLEATIEKAALNSYFLEYKEEMKRRKVLFPGFRAGKLPPYVMPDVRKYLVCYGLETLIGQLCNGNGLKVSLCHERKRCVTKLRHNILLLFNNQDVLREWRSGSIWRG
jgi:hypothetical protein